MTQPVKFTSETRVAPNGLPYGTRNSIMGPAINSGQAIHGNALPVLVSHDCRLITKTFAGNIQNFSSTKLPHYLVTSNNFCDHHPAPPTHLHPRIPQPELYLSPILPKPHISTAGDQLDSFGSPAASIMPYLQPTEGQMTNARESFVDSSLAKPKGHRIAVTKRTDRQPAVQLPTTPNDTNELAARITYPGKSIEATGRTDDAPALGNPAAHIAASASQHPLRQTRGRPQLSQQRTKHRFIEVEMDLDDLEEDGAMACTDDAQSLSSAASLAKIPEEDEAACALLKLAMHSSNIQALGAPEKPPLVFTGNSYDYYNSKSNQPAPKAQPTTARSNSSPIRRQMHIVSEQKRRQTINEGFEELRAIVPACQNFNDSKASVLKKTIYYIKYLEDKLNEKTRKGRSAGQEPRDSAQPNAKGDLGQAHPNASHPQDLAVENVSEQRSVPDASQSNTP